MRLKSLELKGFKSFANETTIHFDESVIGIVGPNGSGKSNIVDAIRWVLGEQKGKELRLESMGDVLFNGTKKRKPGGVCQVAITFENTRNILPTEYQTVTITRILYRSGESEYRLNGVTCRLKDIRSLLMDTGIGSNSYAIIALGMVDDILHNKDNARRRMFEQAAGIAKYKRRKHETLLKLKNTSADLDRVEDLLYEIEGNLRALEKQARRTKRFVDLKELYKEQSIELAVRKSEDLSNRFKDLSKQIETEKDVLRQHEADLAKKEAQLQAIKKGSIDEEQAVSTKQRELNILVGKIRNLESDKSLKEQEMLFLHQSVKKLSEQVNHNTQRLEGLREAITAGTRELQQASQETEQRKVELEEKSQAKVAIEEKYQAMKEVRDTFSGQQQELEEEYIRLEKALASHNTDVVRYTELQSSYADELAMVEAELAARESEHAVLTDQLKTLRSELADRERRASDKASLLADLRAQQEDARSALQKKLRTFDAKVNERDLLKDLIQKLEGYPESIKYLNKSGKWKAQAPLLSDVIYCEPEHRVKVEYLLRGYLNDYVVDTVDDAAEAINLLSSAQKGKANFFILDRIPPSPSSMRDVPDATPLLKYIQCEPKYESLVAHLLGKVYVTNDHPTDARYAAYRDCVLVDAQGLFFLHQNSASGGSVGLFEGKKLGRAKNLERLNEEIAVLEKEIKSLNEDLEALDLQMQLARDESDDSGVGEVREGVIRCEQSLAECSVHVAKLRERKEQLSSRMRESEKALDEVQQQRKSTSGQLAVMKSQMESDASQWKDADQEYGQLLNTFSQANAEYNAAHLAYVQRANQVESLEREIKFKGQQESELKEQVANDQAQIEQDLQTIGQIQTEVEQMGSELIDHYAAKKEQEAELGTAEQQYFEARNEIHELEERIRSIAREQQNSQYLVNQLKEEHNNIRFKLASVSERLQIEFNTRLEDVLEREIHASLALEELEEKVHKLRSRIENFGEINPMAVEAYDEMKERYDVINDQKLDILEAKESLMETIREIEYTATSKFEEAFEKVRAYFIDVFRSLFTEDDSCDLILADPSNPLESDIMIIAKPKGKRPKSLSQLSGGEKTLTATALLFALYLLKPAPFCVFDEVDAPLDDANIEKFNRIIKKFSEQSQFVIVTHNKSTMAAVDIIYGVYMEEQGVSSLSAVDFRYLEHQALLETAEN
ncbi:MAG: chromosome segregation protein SMC [Saprospiraceae bacterium]|nr:chromosome segregation protein SMC [Saprospiraceae bacterium]